ncbi:MAG: HNH endonuclease signature motif containing protein, partial [Clostridium sp.]
AIAPIGYCKHKNPMYKKKKVNKYTPEGRELIYKNISVSQTAIQYMLNNPIENRSIEYNDNRISLYVGQQGKCAVTGNVLDFYNMHCHHKIPRKMGGTDEYNNLVIVEREVHTLIHVVDEEVIAKLLGKLSLDKKKLAKLNTLRTKSGNKAINW